MNYKVMNVDDFVENVLHRKLQEEVAPEDVASSLEAPI